MQSVQRLFTAKWLVCLDRVAATSSNSFFAVHEDFNFSAQIFAARLAKSLAFPSAPIRPAFTLCRCNFCLPLLCARAGR